MTLIYKQSVHAQLLKSDNIIFPIIVQQFIQPGLQRFSCFFHLFDREIFSALVFKFGKRTFNLVNLFPELTLLPLGRQRDFLKLAMSDDDGIIVTGRNSGTKFLTVYRFKILFGGYQNIC